MLTSAFPGFGWRRRPPAAAAQLQQLGPPTRRQSELGGTIFWTEMIVSRHQSKLQLMISFLIFSRFLRISSI
jgi:hypothetical protein